MVRLTHDDLMTTVFAKMTNGHTVAIGNDRKPVLVFADGTVNEDFVNLLRASCSMYATLSFTKTALEALLQEIEKANIDQLAAPLIQLLGGIVLQQKIAVDGIESISGRIPSNNNGPQSKNSC